ncbi:cupin domain-containing protein [Salipiger sp. P9]|uniref:cupin domain-containing protein n=1 Tax=Salipiger pentaromativorans TaxID=2943193 RepID=UPI0021574494|nr:cupin domain-containing protein [Salipiger pentaromativorans]MCR8548428.1 cupin domain-containing protein [Salipiger pentaromativorans]
MPKLTETTVRRDAGDGSCGPYEALLFSDSGGLTQFGAFVEILAPGSRSSIRHWHATEDEMVYVLAGEVTVHEGDACYTLSPGEAATFRAGVPEGHCLENTSAAPVRYLVIGTRGLADVVTYPDHDRVVRLTRDPDSQEITSREIATFDGTPAGSPYDPA